MENKLKLNYKRTLIIGFAFFGILLLWQLYDSWCSRMLTEMFAKIRFNLGPNDYPTKAMHEEVTYLVGVVMAFDNIAALIMLPIFGKLSDKTKTPLGKRTPYIIVGTVVSALALPFIPICFYYDNVAGLIAVMAIVVFFMMMYRNPAVSLMPDITPKPLRSKANGLINIMGYIGGGIATVLGIAFSITKFLGYEYVNNYDLNKYNASDVISVSGESYSIVKTSSWANHNLMAILAPFVICAVIMIASLIVLALSIKENKLEKELQEEMALGEMQAEVVTTEDKPISKENKKILILILIAEFFWFMASNAVSTFQSNYITIAIGQDFSFSMVMTLAGGVGSVLGFVFAGIIAEKIGRKKTIVFGLVGVLVSYVLFSFARGDLIASTPAIVAILLIVWIINGVSFSLVHTNSFPMVVELCSNNKIGQYTGYYYASSMAAQTLTPVLLGLIVKFWTQGYYALPIYASITTAISLAVFINVKNIKTNKTEIKKGLSALDVDD